MSLVKVADNWDALSDSDKVSLFESASISYPSVEELRSLGKFKVATYGKTNEKPVCVLKGTPKAQVVLPKDLLSIKQVEDINKVSIKQVIKNDQKNFTQCLLHFENDSSDEYGNRWIENDGVSYVTDCKFGSRAIKFNSGTLKASEPIKLYACDWTIDFWQKCNAVQTSQYPTFFSNNNYYIRLEPTRMVLNNGTVEPKYNLDTNLVDGNWHHTAVVRKEGVYYIFQDGQLLKTFSDSKTANFDFQGIGHCPQSESNTYLDGIIDEFSLVPWAKWTQNFTPPTTAYKSPSRTLPNDIRFAFTIDKNKYYVFSVDKWEEVQPNEIPTKGMIKSTIDVITKEQWKELISDKGTKTVSKFGVAYSIQQRYIGDDCGIDDITLTIEQKGIWRKSQNWTHYQVNYVDNETVEVTLYNSGSYKINYCLGG